MWNYVIRTGILTDGKRKITCYSGEQGKWKNNPDFVGDVGLGPIPPGNYSIGPAFVSGSSGPVTMRLTPQAGTDTHGRSGFEIHGDSISHPGAASHGCIVTTAPSGRTDREYIDASPDKALRVVAHPTDLVA